MVGRNTLDVAIEVRILEGEFFIAFTRSIICFKLLLKEIIPNFQENK